MQKKLISLILITLGILAIVGGILSATVFKAETEVTLKTPEMADSPFVSVSAEVLHLVNDSVEVVATAPENGEVALILGRTSDIDGWIGSEASYEVTGASDWETLSIQPAAPAQADAQEEESKDQPEPNALEETISDMWVSYQAGEGPQTLTLESVEPGLTLLAVSTAPDAAAPTISTTWERGAGATLLIPGIVVGSLLGMLGLVLLLWPSGNSKKDAVVSAQAKTTSTSDNVVEQTPDSDIARFERATAVDPVPPVRERVLGSQPSGSSDDSAPSVASAASIARAVENEPHLNTGELRQLGLTRRELREMRAAAQAVNSTPMSTPSPQTSAASLPSAASIPSAAESPVREDDASQAPQTSRMSGSNWRAAWGVRTTDENITQSGDTQAFDMPNATSDGSQSGSATTEQNGVSGSSPADSETHSFAPPRNEATDVRDPASWWDNEAPVVPTTRRSMNSAASQTSALSTSSVASATEAHSAMSAHSAPADAEASTAPVTRTGTRRALYSAYRAEAERLSAEGDWPVPAPKKLDDSASEGEGK